MASSSQGPSAGHDTGHDTGSETTNVDSSQTSDKLLGKRRARTTPPPPILETQEEDSLSDRDADWEPEETEVEMTSPGSAPKFLRLTSAELDDRSQRSQGSPGPSPGPSTTRGARGVTTLRHRRFPRTRSSGKEDSPGEYDALPNEAPNFTCNWIPLEFPEQEPCQETCTRLSDLRRHQRPHFEIDLNYAKENLDEEEVAKAQAAIDKCAGRGQSYACEICGKVYSRLDAVARHRQQPQGRQCNIAYKRLRAEERARAKENQAEVEEERGAEKDKDMEIDQEQGEGEHEGEHEKEPGQKGKGKDKQ
ncbi:unnamed protein product [Rhizoctonia solani]|uniref:C2H2-type domain-containing protein n=1 Tax=Rhizoctonia solani TaxID=456999 RepID=A0A8H3HNP1_9AGAM|nr:unnamed protein product [Rhizoctonia solani]